MILGNSLLLEGHTETHTAIQSCEDINSPQNASLKPKSVNKDIRTPIHKLQITDNIYATALLFSKHSFVVMRQNQASSRKQRHIVFTVNV